MQELIFSWQHKAHQYRELSISLKKEKKIPHTQRKIYMYIYNSVNPQLSLVKFRGKERYIQSVYYQFSRNKYLKGGRKWIFQATAK